MRVRYIFVLVAALVISACTPTSTLQEEINPLIGIGEVRSVATGFISTEGPVWHAPSNAMLFSDIPGDTIYSLYADTNEVSVVRSPANLPNGLAIDSEGYLLIAEQQTQVISRMNLVTGEVLPYISRYGYWDQSQRFNSPNDMVIHTNGNIYFTDPPYGLAGRESELGYNGVFVHKPNGEIELLKEFVGQNPNGIIFNPDQSILYLAVSHDVAGPILAFDVDENANLSNEREFARAQNTDGMAMDVYGNLYVATRTAVRVWSPSGREWGRIVLPGNTRTTNVAFGGEDMNTLYITNRSENIYAVELNVFGHQ